MTSKPRSFSQWGQHGRCPHAYYLDRIEKVWRKPAAWSPQGTAVHAGLEAWERSGRTLTLEQVSDVGLSSYTSEINKLLEETPNLRFWFSSGSYTADLDIPRRRAMVPEHLARALGWYEKHPDQTPWTTLDGDPAIELPFSIQLNGITVRGYIDWVGWLDRGILGPRDNKTGRKPGQVMQLKIYGIAIEDHFKFHGAPQSVSSGDFLMTRTGKPTYLQDLTQITRDEVGQEFEKLEADINSGKFPPKPSAEVCWSCDVRHSCKYRAV